MWRCAEWQLVGEKHVAHLDRWTMVQCLVWCHLGRRMDGVVVGAQRHRKERVPVVMFVIDKLRECRLDRLVETLGDAVSSSVIGARMQLGGAEQDAQLFEQVALEVDALIGEQLLEHAVTAHNVV